MIFVKCNPIYMEKKKLVKLNCWICQQSILLFLVLIQFIKPKYDFNTANTLL